jgi:uncharacterized protein (TIGR03086 family)
MELQPQLTKAAAAIIEVVRNVKPDHYELPTPCGDWDVRTLANHLTFWSAFVLEQAGRKLPGPPGGVAEDDDFTGGDWPELYAGQLDKAVAAWADPGAWEGMSFLSTWEMPARQIVGMLFTELVVHGWDLARATGQELTCADDVADAALTQMRAMAEQGRQMGAFGPEIPVAESAPALHRALGLAGRDPDWSA